MPLQRDGIFKPSDAEPKPQDKLDYWWLAFADPELHRSIFAQALDRYLSGYALSPRFYAIFKNPCLRHDPFASLDRLGGGVDLPRHFCVVFCKVLRLPDVGVWQSRSSGKLALPGCQRGTFSDEQG